jgi:hypothetical protein
VDVMNLVGGTSIVAGDSFTCVLMPDETVKRWD